VTNPHVSETHEPTNLSVGRLRKSASVVCLEVHFQPLPPHSIINTGVNSRGRQHNVCPMPLCRWHNSLFVQPIALDGNVQVQTLEGISQINSAEGFDTIEAVEKSIAVDIKGFG
jgi:hypothetical protein